MTDLVAKIILTHPWLFMMAIGVLFVVFPILAIIFFSKGTSLDAGVFHWKARIDTRVSDLEEQIKRSKLDLRKADLESRIKDEFKTLRTLASSKRRLFGTNMAELYRKTFALAIKELCPMMNADLKDRDIDRYKLLVLLGLITHIGPEQLRLVFENDFLPLPTAETPKEVERSMISEFLRDSTNRSYYLLTISTDIARTTWDFPFPRELFEQAYMAKVEDEAIRQSNNYFHEVILARDTSIMAMFHEYGDLFFDFISFKKYVIKRLQELY